MNHKCNILHCKSIAICNVIGAVSRKEFRLEYDKCLACAVPKPEADIAQMGVSKVPHGQEKIPVAAKPAAQMEHVEEAKRLLSERSSLLKTGSYSKESVVIQQLDAKIQELGNKALGTWAPAS